MHNMVKNIAIAVLAAYAVAATFLLARPAERAAATRPGDAAPAPAAARAPAAPVTTLRPSPPRHVQAPSAAAALRGPGRAARAGTQVAPAAGPDPSGGSADAAAPARFPFGPYDPAKLRLALDRLAGTDLPGDLRCELEAWLGEAVEQNPEAARAVLARLRSESDPDLLWTLAAALGRSPEDAIGAELVRMAREEPDAARRRAALGSLGGRSDQKPAVEALLAAARSDADPGCRAAGAAGLNLPLTYSTCRNEDRLELLTRVRSTLRDLVVKESDLDLRTCALNALGSACSTPEDVDLLVKVARTESSADLRAVAVSALARTGRKDAPVVQPLIAIAQDRSQDLALRMAAASALEEMMVLDPAVDSVIRAVSAELERAAPPTPAHAGEERAH